MNDSLSEFYFPPTRFFGSKRRFAPWIYECFRQYKVKTALDLFGGTATVSLLLAQMGIDVTYCDGMNANRLCARALTGDVRKTVSAEKMGALVESVSPRRGFISDNFQGLYYTEEEDRWIDGLLSVLQDVKCGDTTDIVLYCLFQACLQKRPFNMFHRANLGLRKKQVARTFGNHSTWERSFDSLMMDALACAARARSVANSRVVVSAGQAPSLVRPGFDLVYIDPPYLPAKKSPESYVDRYHFIEGISLGEDWGKVIDFDSGNKRFHRGYFDESWESRSRFVELLSDVIRVHKGSIVALSYAEGRDPEVKKIASMFRSEFKSVRVERYRASHALSSAIVEEVMVIGEPY